MATGVKGRTYIGFTNHRTPDLHGAGRFRLDSISGSTAYFTLVEDFKNSNKETLIKAGTKFKGKLEDDALLGEDSCVPNLSCSGSKITFSVPF